MKTKNFPMKKLMRQLRARGEDINSKKNQRLLEEARDIRTKKDRG